MGPDWHNVGQIWDFLDLFYCILAIRKTYLKSPSFVPCSVDLALFWPDSDIPELSGAQAYLDNRLCTLKRYNNTKQIDL